MPQPNANGYSNSTTAISDGHRYGYCDNNATAVPDGYCDSDGNCYGLAECYADTLSDAASANAKATAHTVSSADALRMKDPDSRAIGDQ